MLNSNSVKTFFSIDVEMETFSNHQTDRIYHQQTEIKVNIKENLAYRKNMIQEMKNKTNKMGKQKNTIRATEFRIMWVSTY